MRRRILPAAVLLPAALLLWQLPAWAGTAPEGLREPVRLTAGGADQLMGMLAPGGQDLYFASNRNATWQIFVQDLEKGAPQLVFENDADATDPRVSPDGTRLLYLSYKTDATGNACLMELETGAQRCLTGERTAEAQAFWFPDGRSVGVVSRSSLHGDFELVRYPAEGGRGEPVLERNLASPSVSPDGHWLAYVPVERDATEVGVNFARRAGTALELYPLDRKGDPISLAFELPGTSGFPSFSRDGLYLYFSQYLNDTNFDGRIDGDDNSVLFRVPFHSDRARPVDPAQVEQLTSARWNCQYPEPASDRLIATCAHQGSLDIYSLPHEGTIPSVWKRARLEEELNTSRDHWQKVLLLGRLLRLETTSAGRASTLREMVRLHLELGEYESAEFYARQTKALAQQGDPDGVSAQAEVLLELIAARREERRLNQGQLNVGFVRAQRTRIARLEALAASGGRPVATLAALAMSELDDIIGDKEAALEALKGIDVRAEHDRFVVHAYGAHVPRLFAELEVSEQQLAALQALSSHPDLPVRERLWYAERFVRALVRGASRAARARRIEVWLGRVPPDSEAAFMLVVERHLQRLTPETREDVRKSLFELYKDNKDFERRKALVLSTLREAAGRDEEYLLYEFTNTWVSGVKRDQSERRYAEALYRQVLLERAYIAQSQGNPSDARGYFYGVTLQTDTLEAHIGFIEARLLEGKDDVEAQYAKRYKDTPDDPVYHFVQAYLLARRLSGLDDDAHAEAASQAMVHLARAGDALPRSLEVHHLWGFIAHQRFLRTGEAGSAQEANTHYLLALDLARENPRAQAALLLALGLLQASVDNHRVALDYLEKRAKLPFLHPEQALAERVARARSLFHAGALVSAADDAAAAVQLIDGNPKLERFRPLALDRAALYAYVAGRYDQAWTWYEALKPQLEPSADHAMRRDGGGDPDLEAQRTRFKSRLGRGLTLQQLGRHREAIQELEEIQRTLDAGAALWPEAQEARKRRFVFAGEDYRLLVAGLLAHSDSTLGDYAAATRRMRQRQDLLEARLEATDLDEDVLELAAVCHHLAGYAYREGKTEEARTLVAKGYHRAMEYNQRTGSTVTTVSLQLLRDYAELYVYGRIPLASLGVDLKAELERAYRFICEKPNPDWATDRYFLGLYLTLLELED